MDTTQTKEPSPAAASDFSFFDAFCMSKGLDPAKERAAMKAREAMRDYTACPRYGECSESEPAVKPQPPPPPGLSQAIMSLPADDDAMPMCRTKAELRAFLVELLMDDIIEICLGAMERKSS